MHMKSLVVSTLLLAAHAMPTHAAAIVQTGTGSNGLKWTASTRVVGVTSTGTNPSDDAPNTTPGGGDPIYLAPNSAGYSGVVGILMTFNNGFQSVCSGSLVGNRSVVTAAHCVSGGGGVKLSGLTRTQIFFQDDISSAGDERTYGIPDLNVPAGVTMIDVSNYTVNAGYAGTAAIDQNDIAVLTLADIAPAYAKRYELYTDDLTGKQFNVTGYGQRSSVGGAEGIDFSTIGTVGYRRQGENVFDFAFGDEALGGFFTDPAREWYLGPVESKHIFVADFDNGLPAQDTSCRVSTLAIGAADANALGFCNLGVGAREATIAPGDSGGGAFINGRLASVSSFGVTVGSQDGDLDDEVNYTFGEFAGYVPIFLHADFIRGAIAAVPEPATWAQMLLGFGMIGAATRRRRRRPTIVTA